MAQFSRNAEKVTRFPPEKENHVNSHNLAFAAGEIKQNFVIGCKSLELVDQFSLTKGIVAPAAGMLLMEFTEKSGVFELARNTDFDIFVARSIPYFYGAHFC